MKTQHFALIILLFVSSTSFAQTSFGVSPGIIGFSGARIGYKVNKIMPYFSLQYAGVKYSYEDNDPDFGYTEETKLGIYVPNLGLRYYLKDEEVIKTFLNLGFSKPILTGKQTLDGEEEPGFDDTVKETSLFGMETSFGAEYLFNEHFSLSGEYGLRVFNLKQESEEFDYLEKVNISPTFSRITLNYYF